MTHSLLMSANVEEFNRNNEQTRRDATNYLLEYNSKFKSKKSNVRVLDIGCGDGSVTEIISNHIPKNFETLMGCDKNDDMVTFANSHYKNHRTTFFKLDIEDDLPKAMHENFDFVFSFYLFHWIRNQEKGFSNIYNALQKNGSCFMTFFAYFPVYTIFIALSKTEKWGSYLKDVSAMVSPYHGVQDPDRKVTEILKRVGFQNIDVSCKQNVFVYKKIQHFKDIIGAINPFRFPQNQMYAEFLNDFIDVAREMRMINSADESLILNYNLIVVYCTK